MPLFLFLHDTIEVISEKGQIIDIYFKAIWKRYELT